MITQGIIASIASASGGGGGTPQPTGLYAWQWDSDYWSTNSLPNAPYNGAGSSGYTSEPVALTAAGGWTSTSTTWSNSNGGFYISGSTSGSFLQTPDFTQSVYSSSWASGTRTGLTIELWFYPTAGARTLVSEQGAGGADSAGWRDNIIELNSNGTVVADIWPYTGGPITTANSVNFNAWNHVIYTYNISTTTLSLQLNGGTVVSNSSKTWQCGVENGGGLHYAIGYADATNLMANANTTNFDGRWGKIRIANYPMAGNYDADWTKYNPLSFSVADSGTSLGANWTVEIVGDFHPTTFWATMWGNEVWNSSTGHLAYLTSMTSLNVGRPNAQLEYTLAQSVSTKSYWAFVHSDGSAIDVYRNGQLLYETANNYTQPAPASNTLLFGARHTNDGTGQADTCPGNYLYTNITQSALSPATITSNYNTLKTTYGLP